MRSTHSASITIILAVIALAMAVTGMVNDDSSSRPAHSASRASTDKPLSDASDPDSQSHSESNTQSHYQYLVATAFVHSGDPISKDAVTLVQSDIDIADAIPASQFHYGVTPLRNVSAGSVLVSDHFNNTSLVSPRLSAGYQAMAIPVDEVAGVGGLLRPGDTVNVIAAFKKIKNKLPSAIVLIKSITVLAVDGVLEISEKDEKKKSGKSRAYTAVLMVPEQDVARLLLASAEGELRLAITNTPANPITDNHHNRNTDTATNTNTVAAPLARLAAQTADTQVNPEKDDYARLEDLFPAPPPNRHPRGYAGSKVQIYRGTEAGSVYVH